VDRRTLGGWLSGPGSGLDAASDQYRGERLGLPAEGPGSVAGVGRRLVAVTIDWFAAGFISRLIFPDVVYGSRASSVAVLGIFAVMTALLVWLLGATIGHRLLNLQVVRLGDQPRVALPYALLRTVLLCLVIPAVIWDRDGRGFHDKAAGTVCIRTAGRPARP